MAEGNLKRVEITPEALAEHMKEGVSIQCVDGLPLDGEVSNAGYDYENDKFFMFIESEEYEEVKEAEYIPETVPEFEAEVEPVGTPQAPKGDYPASK